MRTFAKNILRKGFTITWAKSPKSILKSVENSSSSVISFDVFDTLVERLVNRPEDVFCLLQVQYENHFGKYLPVATMRRKAEERAREKATEAEVTLDEIYGCMDVPEQERNWLKAQEVADEIALCVPKQEMRACYEKALGTGKRVVLTSDMYLPRTTIETILQKCNISGYSNLYLSSERRHAKRDGSLFREVLREEKIKPEQVLHIGDNARSDFLIPLRLGLKALLLKTVARKHESNPAYAVLRNFIRRNEGEYSDAFVRLGYRALGPMLYGFSRWLKKEVIRRKADRVLFLMREGSLLKKAYESVGGSSDSASLLYVSRQSTTLPFLGKDASLRQLLKRLAARRVCYTVRDFCNACLLTSEDIKEIIPEEEMQENMRSWTPSRSKDFYDKIRPALEKSARRNLDNLLQYLKRVGLGSRNLAVDVGYCGTIQSNLQQTVLKSEFFGAYLGYYLDKGKVEAGKATGFYFSQEDNTLVFDMALTSGVFELLFLDTCGTTLAYDTKGNPILAKQDNDAEQADRICRAQNAAMRFVRDFAELDKTLNLAITPKEWFSFYSDFARHPTKKFAQALTGFEFRDARVVPLLPEKTRGYYLFHPKELLRDFLESGCKVYFFKRLFVLPLPYYRFLVWLRRLDKKSKS